MKKIWTKIVKWWYFHVANPVVRKGEAGGFRFVFRRFTMDVETLSGNWKARWTADLHPYGALVSREGEDDIHGYCQIIYEISKLLTTDQKFAEDVVRSISKYNDRLEKKASREVVEDDTQEKIALEEMKQVQEVVEMPTKERRKYERGVDGRFRKAVKKAEKLAE